MAENKPAFSFGFSKKVETKKLSKSSVGEGTDDAKAETDFVLSLEGNTVNSTVPKQKEKEPYVIPLIKKNRWRSEAEKRLSDVKKEADPNETDPNDLDQLAAKEVLAESAKYNESWEDRDKPDPNLAIPLLMQNKVPEGFETDDKLDVGLRPEEPDDADYEQIPIEQFGFAMLRGMGWKEGQGIGKNGKLITPVEAHLRPKGLGLGADRSQAPGDKDKKKDQKLEGKEEEKLEMKKGSYCVILNGKQKDLYGVVEGIDEDNARVFLKLALSGQSVTMTQYNVKVVGKKEYDKYSKYLNKGKSDRYKEEEMKQNEHEHDSGQNGKDRDDHRSHGDDKHRRKDGESSRKRKQDSKDSSDSKHQKSGSKSLSYSKQSNSTLTWLRPNLRVRIVDKHYKKGRYYKDKVVVMDVISVDCAVCKTDDGKVLEDLSHSQVETVIPKSDSAHVMLCRGEYKGQIGKIVKKDKDACRALIQLLSDRDVLVKMDFDEICDYVGSIEDEFDY
ncbi:G-patch domain and KOW motifs-containing protein-like [Littorina saxatilis]|uniref:G-patch domain-containing protein n=1 Tax=Littorina saxatilis TaxID=31220 RepID=A0AAN9BA05_9CAEN